jgi:membrane-associated phospholipid phosphatase
MPRRLFALYLCFGLVGLQATFGVEQVGGVRLPPWPMVVMVIFVWPVGAAAWALRRGWLPLALPPRWPRWLWGSLGLFGLWAAGYFAIGAWVAPSRVRVFSTGLEDALPFWPTASLLYLCVDPLFFLPFAVLPDQRALRRHSLAVLGVLAVSFTVWALYPVAFPRPEVPPDAPGFGAWVLRTIQGSDPAVNCLPSTHCAMALLAALSVLRAHRALGLYALFTAGAIGLSTVLTRQHFVVDVLTGYALGAGAFALTLGFARPPAGRRADG